MSIRVLVPVGVALVMALSSGSAQSQSPGTALSPSQSTDLQGKTGSARATAIGQLAPHLTSGLTAQDTAAILGAPSELSEVHRVSAIRSIAQAKKLGTLSADAALILKATTGTNRAQAINQIAPYLKAGLTVEEMAEILGAPSELSEVHRVSAIRSIAQAKKLGTLSADAALLLKGTTGSNRAQAINLIAPYLKADLTAQEMADILGGPSELSEVHRASAIGFIARAKKIKPGFSEAELAPVLAGMSGSNRTLALSALRAPASPVTAVPPVASASVPTTTASAPATTPPTQVATPGPALTAIVPESVTGSKTAQTFSLHGSNLKSGLRITVFASNFQKTLNPAQVRWKSASEVEMTIVTGTAADNWSVEVANPDGRRSARMEFRVNAPTTVAGGAPSGAPASSPTTAGATPAASSPPTISRVDCPIPGASMATTSSRLRLPEQSKEVVTRAGHAYPFALLSLHTYSAANCKTGDVVAALTTKLGQEEWRMANFASDAARTGGFKAATYVNARSRQCAIVFAGTDDRDDFITDVIQTQGVVPAQYANGLQYALAQINTHCARMRVVIAGHSLGGGIAQYVNYKTEQKYITLTFNPAGLGVGSWATLGFPNIPAGNIVSFYAAPFNPATGQRGITEPVHVIGVQLGRQVAIPVFTTMPFTHSMTVLLEGIRIQRDYCVAKGGCK